jgi:putative peptide zinc metalloprotease protein
MDRGEESATSVKSTGAGFGVLTHYFSLPRVDSLVTSAYRSWFRFLFQRPVLAALALVGLSGSLFFLIRLFTGTLPHPDPSNLAAVSLGTVVAIGVQVVLHETAHAVTCKHFGREVRRAGIGWYFLMPVAFVDTSDIWLSGRLARMSVALAGPATNLVLAAGATLLLPLASPTAAAVLASFAVVGFSIALLNMNPLMEFDVYYVLMDLVDVPNLRSRAIGYIGSLATRRRPELGRREARILLVYGLLALAYTAFVALAILNGYRQYVDAALAGRLPYFLTAPLGWGLSLAVVWLILRRTWADLRHKRRAF